MWTALDKSWIVSTPTKTGTRHFLNTLKRYEGWEQTGGFHAGHKPEHRLEGYQRYILFVRDPFERMVSVYWYWLTENSSGVPKRWGKQGFDDFGDFSKFIGGQYSTLSLWRPLRWYVEHFKPDEYVIMENDHTISKLLESIHPTMPQVYWNDVGWHKTKHRKSVEETLEGVTLHDSFLKWLEADYASLPFYTRPAFLHSSGASGGV